MSYGRCHMFLAVCLLVAMFSKFECVSNFPDQVSAILNN